MSATTLAIIVLAAPIVFALVGIAIFSARHDKDREIKKTKCLKIK